MTYWVKFKNAYGGEGRQRAFPINTSLEITQIFVISVVFYPFLGLLGLACLHCTFPVIFTIGETSGLEHP